ncbi:DMT family transporter [Nodosilinea sp. LEGE 07088]|uniref:DMT family transporter n=1 Tax=Nodosilinea sp. LEGE 07088 TaxID=2777968 RepID=UPI00187FF2D0|nr:DMT family transporter [Nodosilinea sp. LEGE 07088]MBE9139968.1 DMT family transporter [Nodosilinea sp. LEGE 07088]
MSTFRTLLLTTLAMLAFAGNSLLCRMALNTTTIDAGSFTLIRLLSGALMLGFIVGRRGGLAIAPAKLSGRWAAAIALFIYAICFAVAYVSLPAATGALLLFGAVQVTMIGYGLWRGERLSGMQTLGVVAALAGLVGLLLPGVSTPPLGGAVLMLGAGVAWGIYSLLGQGVINPIETTGGNFLRAVPLALLLSLTFRSELVWDGAGALYALASGAIASGLGYALWYQALPGLKSAQAATVQLSVPILAAIGATIWLQEPITLRLGLAAVAVLGGIALVIGSSPPSPPPLGRSDSASL